ncbi:MAG: response regulator [Deltaproteobacteria bacterium]|nr:response regulator [Deltaproteobacteria bacterium]
MSTREPEQLNVLVVDDDPGTLKVLGNIVTRQNHYAIQAESAEEILKLLPYWTFHVALLDHGLPGMQGMMLGEYLRRNNPDMTIALVTGENDPVLEQRAGKLGILYIAKPFTIGEVTAVIDKHIAAAEERELRRQNKADDEYAPPIARFAETLKERYNFPNIPGRVESRLVETLKVTLNNLRSAQRYNERDRVIALAGLITAKVLGIRLPKSSAGLTLFEDYDTMMQQRGRRQEFTKR